MSPTNYPTQADDPAAQRLREAHRVLDERPSEGVRNAILRKASAIRSAAPGPAREERKASPWMRWRPSFAAIGTVCVAVLAVGAVIQMQREARSPAAPMASMPPMPQIPPMAPEPARELSMAPQGSAPARAPAAALSQEARSASVQGELASAAAERRARAIGVRAPAYRASAKTWLDQVIALRLAHRDHDADEELRLLRAAYPDLQIPKAATSP